MSCLLIMTTVYYNKRREYQTPYNIIPGICKIQYGMDCIDRLVWWCNCKLTWACDSRVAYNNFFIYDCALHFEDFGAKSSLVSMDSSSATTHDNIAWEKGLKRSGLYFDGFVDDIESVLEKHRRDTVNLLWYSNIYWRGCWGERCS